MDKGTVAIYVYGIAFPVVLFGICAFIANWVHKYRTVSEGRFQAAFDQYILRLGDEDQVARQVKFTVYSGILAWVDQYTFSIPIAPTKKAEAARLIHDLSRLNTRYSLFAYGCLFIPILVYLNKRKALRTIDRL